MSEHTGTGGDFYAQSFQLPSTYTSSTGRREGGVRPYSAGAARLESSNYQNLRDAGSYKSESDKAKSDPLGTFARGATMSWVDELQNAPPWLMEFKNMYQEVQGMALAHGAGMVAGRIFRSKVPLNRKTWRSGTFGNYVSNREASMLTRRFVHRAYRSHVRKQPVHASWAKAFHKH